MKLAIIGSNDFYDLEYLEKFIKENISENIDMIITEDIFGVSKISKDYASKHGIDFRLQSASSLNKEKFGSKAPHINNEIIAKECNVLVVLNESGDEKFKYNNNIVEKAKRHEKTIISAPESEIKAFKSPRVYLYIPYHDKEQMKEAKVAGARFDKERNQYYVVSIEEQKKCAKWIPDKSIESAISSEVKKLQGQTQLINKKIKGDQPINSDMANVEKIEKKLQAYAQYFKDRDKNTFSFNSKDENRIYINIDHRDKERIKKRGDAKDKIEGVNARWDPQASRWYVTNVNSFLLAREVDKDHHITMDKLISEGTINVENLKLPTKSDLEIIQGILDNVEKFNLNTTRIGYEIDTEKFFEFMNRGIVEIEKIPNDYMFSDLDGFKFIAVISNTGATHLYNDYEDFKMKLNQDEKKEIVNNYEKDYDFDNEREKVLNEFTLPKNPITELPDDHIYVHVEDEKMFTEDAFEHDTGIDMGM